MQGQKEPSTQWRPHHAAYVPLRQRHPVLTPLVLLGGALLASIASIFADTLFSVFALAGLSVGTFNTCILFCLLVAVVLGIVGVLASIIAILEHIDRYGSTANLPLHLFIRLKEQSYANRN